MGGGFPRRPRQMPAEILDAFQENLTRNGANRPVRTAFNACECSFHVLDCVKGGAIWIINWCGRKSTTSE